MKKLLVLVMVVCVGIVLVFSGCAKKAATSNDAISQADTLKTLDEKVKFLVSQANDFLDSKQYQQAVNVAQYILSNFDKNSADAKSILQKATDMLKAEASKVVDKAKSDVQNKLGSFGK